MATRNSRTGLTRAKHRRPNTTVAGESLVTGGLVLAISLVLSAGGLLLLTIGGIAILFASVLLAFGAMGCIQAVLIVVGHGPASGRPRDKSVDDR